MPSSRALATCRIAISFCCLLRAASFAADFTFEEVLAKHLASIGPAPARNVKSRVVQGGATYRVLVGGTGAVDGKFVAATEGQDSDVLYKVNFNGFMGEQFISDGRKISVAATYTNKTRSDFGDFILSQDAIVKEGLLGGVWSVGWPLLDLEGRKAKLHAEGRKKLDGKEFFVLSYHAKKSTDADIFLYFDPDTCRHVMTVYKMQPSDTLVGGERSQARKQQERYQLDERFADFKTIDGLTLPTHYDLRFTLTTEHGFNKSIEWEVKAINIMNNQSIDARSFEVK